MYKLSLMNRNRPTQIKLDRFAATSTDQIYKTRESQLSWKDQQYIKDHCQKKIPDE